ncbi:ribonuclease H-like domain, reverse transcriptase, RNA-dependent DNA polymerase [Tanacetum coccineum]
MYITRSLSLSLSKIRSHPPHFSHPQASIQLPHNDSGHGEYGRVSDCVRNDVVTSVEVSQTWRAHTNNAGHEVAAAQLARAIHEQGVSRGALYRASPQLCGNFEHNVAAHVLILIGCNCFVVAETSVCFANRAWWNNIEREAQATGLSDLRLGTMDRRMKVDELNEPSLRCPGIRSLLPLPGGAPLIGGIDLKICRWDHCSLERSYCISGPSELEMTSFMKQNLDFRYMWVYFLKSKDEAFETFKEFKLKVENEVGKKIRSFRTDRGGEFTSREFTRYYNENDIVRQLTTPYSPQQNGIVERRNRVPIKALKDSTPYEALKVRKPNMKHLRIFRCKGLIHQDQLIQEPVPKQIVLHYSDHIKGCPTYYQQIYCKLRCKNSRKMIGWDWESTQDPERNNEDSESSPKQNNTHGDMSHDEIVQPIDNLSTPPPYTYEPNSKESTRYTSSIARRNDSINKTTIHGNCTFYLDNQKAIRLKWHGIDYDEVFAPVVRMGTVRLILALSAYHGWEVHHLDVKSAFLHGLVKALRVKAKPPVAWNMKLDQTLKSLDFKKCTLEQAIYTKISKDSMLLVGVYVACWSLCGRSSKEDLQKFKSQIEEKFKMSDLGLLAYYLGIEVTQTEGGISIKQTGYANKILKEARMVDCNETKIPMDPGTKLIKTEGGELVDAMEYKSLIGRLRYLLHTRPDLSYSVGLLSRFMQEPREQHMKAIRQVLRYIKGTLNFGITYYKKSGCKLHGFSDSSYGINIEEGKGTTGIVFYFGNSQISWSSRKQLTVALSSCESEFMAATAAELVKHYGYKDY